MTNKQIGEMHIVVTGDIHSKNEVIVVSEVANLIDQVTDYIFEKYDDPGKVQVACLIIVANFLERLLPINTDEDNQNLMRKAFVLLSNQQFCSEAGFHEVQA